MTTAEKLVERLGELGRTCGTAESCTGGGIGSAITAVPGSSAVFMGGVISYDNSVKQGVLGVSPETLATVGAVSALPVQFSSFHILLKTTILPCI